MVAEARVSPILVRPVREQLEHDRVIRLLQQDLQKRKVEVGINPGAEQNASVGSGSRKEFPDAVVYSLDKGKKVVAVVEVETGESVNHLEAMAQWAHLAKLRVPFHLYVPINSIDVARRLSNDHKIAVTEIWSYHQVGDQFKFTLVHPAAGGRGRGPTQPPRTVSVATIRVVLPLEPELPLIEELPAPSASIPAAKSPAGKDVSAKTGKGVAQPSPRVVPVKSTAKPPAAAPVVVAKVAVGKPSAVRAAAKPAPAKPSVKASVPKAATQARGSVKPVVKTAAKAPAARTAAKPTSKPAVKTVTGTAARAVPPKANPLPRAVPARPAARSAAKSATKSATVAPKPTAKAPARPVAKLATRAIAKPVARRK